MTESNDQLQLLQKISYALDQLVRMARVMSYPTIREALETILDTDEKRLVYHSLDGTKSVAAIQQLTGVSPWSISTWGREWENLGIVEPSSASNIPGRRQKSFDLGIYGISIPEGNSKKTDNVT